MHCIDNEHFIWGKKPPKKSKMDFWFFKTFTKFSIGDEFIDYFWVDATQ